MAILKGQNLRLFLNKKVIGCSTSCTLHLSADLEDTSTKDSTGMYKMQECTGLSWDCSVDALMQVAQTVTGEKTVDDIMDLIGQDVIIEFVPTSGDNNRTRDDDHFIKHGHAIVNDISINAGNRSNVTYSVQLSGNGPLTSGPSIETVTES